MVLLFQLFLLFLLFLLFPLSLDPIVYMCCKYISHTTIFNYKIYCEVYVLCITCSVSHLGHKAILYVPFVIASNQNSVILHRESGLRCERAHQPRLGQEGNLVQHPCLAMTATPSHIACLTMCCCTYGILKTTSWRTEWPRPVIAL